MDVGATAPFSVWTHCGVRYTTIDGIYWETRDGQINPRPEYPEWIRGTLNRTSQDSAIFTGTTIPITLTYHPAPDAKFYCQ